MGMSTHVIGLKPVDDHWKKMYEVYKACDTAGISPPEEVRRFFDGIYFKHIEVKGIEVELDKAAGVTKYNNENCSGFEIEVAKIPPNVKIIRFYNSW